MLRGQVGKPIPPQAREHCRGRTDLIKTLKYEGLFWPLVSFCQGDMRRLIRSISGWYNEHHPHTTLKGCTPNERYFGRFPANRKPRIEPRSQWPRASPCARPHTLVGGKPGTRFELHVDCHDGYAHLPIVTLRRMA